MMGGKTPEDLDRETEVSLYSLREIRRGAWPHITDAVKERHGVWNREKGCSVPWR